MQVSPLDTKKFKEEIKPSLPKAVIEDPNKVQKAVNYAQQKDIKVYNLTFVQAAKTIYTREGFPGFMRGFTPSMIKNTLNAGTYFSMLFYFEQLIHSFNMFPDHVVSMMASGGAKTL